MEHVTLNLNLLYNSRIGELFLFLFFFFKYKHHTYIIEI